MRLRRCEHAFVWTCPCVCTDVSVPVQMHLLPHRWVASTPWMPRDLERLYKRFSNIPFSLPSSPWLGEAMVCLVDFVVWATIRGSFFGHTCCCANQVCFYSAFGRLFQYCCCLDYNDEDPC